MKYIAEVLLAVMLCGCSTSADKDAKKEWLADIDGATYTING
jgi:hypothetical protein